MEQRYLALDAGPFRVSLPLISVRQILDLGGDKGRAPMDPRALGVMPVSLARVLGAEPLQDRPALLLLDGKSGPLLLSVCRLGGVAGVARLEPLPPTVTVRYPRLLQGIIVYEGMRFVLEPDVLAAVVEERLRELDEEEAA